MNEQEIKKFIEDNLEIGIYQPTNQTGEELYIKVALYWKDDKYNTISEDKIAIKLNRDSSLSYMY